MPHNALHMVAWLVAMYPPCIFGASVMAGASSLVLLWAGLSGPNGFAIDGAMLTGVGSIIGILVGAVATWRNQAIAAEKARLDAIENGRQNALALERIRSDAHDREQARKYQADQAELDRKERMHDLAGKMNVLSVRLEEKTIELERLKAHLAGQDVRMTASEAAVGANSASIEAMRQGDSGSFPAVGTAAVKVEVVNPADRPVPTVEAPRAEEGPPP